MTVHPRHPINMSAKSFFLYFNDNYVYTLRSFLYWQEMSKEKQSTHTAHPQHTPAHTHSTHSKHIGHTCITHQYSSKHIGDTHSHTAHTYTNTHTAHKHTHVYTHTKHTHARTHHKDTHSLVSLSAPNLLRIHLLHCVH